MIDINLWFTFPVAVGIATIVMSAGIGGAFMFAPFFMLVLRLDPLLALGAGLAIEVFGFSSWSRIGKSVSCSYFEDYVGITDPISSASILTEREGVFAIKILALPVSVPSLKSWR